MSTVGSFDRTQHLAELNTPLIGGPSGTLTPTQRKGRVIANLGLGAGTSTPGTATPGDAMVTDANNGIGGFRDTRVTDVYSQPAPQTATGTATLTAAQIMGGILVGTPAAAAVYTSPLGTAIESALIALYPGLQVDDSFDLTVINLGADTFTITFAVNTGVTFVGDLVIDDSTETAPGSSSGTFRFRRTAANVYVGYRVS